MLPNHLIPTACWQGLKSAAGCRRNHRLSVEAFAASELAWAHRYAHVIRKADRLSEARDRVRAHRSRFCGSSDVADRSNGARALRLARRETPRAWRPPHRTYRWA